MNFVLQFDSLMARHHPTISFAARFPGLCDFDLESDRLTQEYNRGVRDGVQNSVAMAKDILESGLSGEEIIQCLERWVAFEEATR